MVVLRRRLRTTEMQGNMDSRYHSPLPRINAVKDHLLISVYVAEIRHAQLYV